MNQPILYGSPTFLFRHICGEKLEEVVNLIARCGFDGLELYGMFGHSAATIKAACDAAGLRVICDHVPYEEFVANTRGVLQARSDMGARYITLDRIPDTHLPGGSAFHECRAAITSIGREAKAMGMQLLYHNHGYDLTRRVNGTPILDLLLDSIDEDILEFQPDLGWLQLGGGNAAYYLQKYRHRCPIVHMKDYYATGPVRMESPNVLGEKRGGEAFYHFEFRPSGYGVMNFPALMPLVLACEPEWIVADHDMSYERDVETDLRDSLYFLKKCAGLQV